MKFSTKVILGVVALGVMSGIYYWDNYRSQQQKIAKEELRRALYFKPENAVKFTLKNSHGEFIFERANKNKDWQMESPLKINADNNAVDNSVNLLSHIFVQQILRDTSDKDKTNQTFGLNPPRATASVTLADGSMKTLEMGNYLDIGSSKDTGAHPMSAYVYNVDKSHILVAEIGGVRALQSKEFAEFRSKKIGTLQADDVAGFSISSQNINVIAEKKDGQWHLKGPQGPNQADPSFISSFINGFASMSADRVIETANVKKKGLASFSLAKPTATVSFFDKKGTVLQTFQLGITKQGMFIAMPFGAVGQLPLSDWGNFVPLAIKFRDRHILSGIEISKIEKITRESPLPSVSQPVKEAPTLFAQLQSLSADDIIFTPSAIELKQFGLQAPTHAFSFVFSEGANQPPLKVSIGHKVPHRAKSVYLKRSDSQFVYIVNDTWLPLLDKLSVEKKSTKNP